MTASHPVSRGEQQLVERLRRGEPEAFNEVYEAHRARMFTFLVRLSGRGDLAEDLSQELWLRLAAHAHRLAEDTRLEPWLFRVARNLFISHVRLLSLEKDRLSAFRLLPQQKPPPSPFELVAANQAERRLERAIADLPVKYREVLLLVLVERLEPKEAAAILEVRPDALRQRLSRARAMLKDALEREES